MSKAQFEDRLMPLMGLDKIIWLPGIKGTDITDGHTDFYARFARPGVVLAGLEMDEDLDDYDVTRTHLDLLRAATDAKGRRLQVLTLEAPSEVRPQWLENDGFAAGYIGYYVCNGAVMMQQFGDREADARARATLEHAFPGRKIEILDMDGIAAGGGSIHCATQQQPA
jgi:agmatine deiminase